MSNADRFLEAFNEIEAELARRNDAKQYAPFGGPALLRALGL